MPLTRWLSRSYLRAAIIPLLLIEIGFLAAYWISSNFTYQRNAETVSQLSANYLSDIANREATTISATLAGVEGLGRIFAQETGEALATPYDPPASEKARYAMSADGAFYTVRGKDEAAAFYSGYVPVGPTERDKVWRTVRLDHLMKHIVSASPLVRQVYVNSWDSYNRIYPYFDVRSQYPAKMNIPSYNFYYEADARHNPKRQVVWTDAYVDPAGSGWMVSAIAPVYSPRRLEAVIGIDLTVDTIIRNILSINLPWHGYAMLISRDGTILALPKAGERDLGLKELKDHSYSEAIQADTFKPAQFNISQRSDLKPLAQALAKGKRGAMKMTLGGQEMLAAQAPVAGPGWRLVVLAPLPAILADATNLRNQLRMVSIGMIVILVLFYCGFFLFLIWRARSMSRRLAEPLMTLETLMERMGNGAYDQQAPRFGVNEIDTVSQRLVATGHKLGSAYRQIVEQEDEVRRALDREKRISSGQRRFISILSHEFRTPLTVIHSCGQILQRRADRISEEMALERGDKICRASQRIEDVIKSALQMVQVEEGELKVSRTDVAAGDMAHAAVAMIAPLRSDIGITVHGDDTAPRLHIDPAMIKTALAAILENASQYSHAGGEVRIEIRHDAQNCQFIISDQGTGIPPEDLPQVGERFFRGSNSTAVPGAGTGLYLATTLVKAHGGSISIESRPDIGTTVTVSLPRSVPDQDQFPEAA